MAWQLMPTAQQAFRASTASRIGKPTRRWPSALLMSATCTSTVMQSTCLSSCCSSCCRGQSLSFCKGGRKLLCAQSSTLDWKLLVRTHGCLLLHANVCCNRHAFAVSPCKQCLRCACTYWSSVRTCHIEAHQAIFYLSSTEDRMNEAL